MRRTIEEELGLDAVDIYGLSEIIGPGVACAEAKAGAHIFEDHFLAEIVDPETRSSSASRGSSPTVTATMRVWTHAPR